MAFSREKEGKMDVEMDVFCLVAVFHKQLVSGINCIQCSFTKSNRAFLWYKMYTMTHTKSNY